MRFNVVLALLGFVLLGVNAAQADRLDRDHGRHDRHRPVRPVRPIRPIRPVRPVLPTPAQFELRRSIHQTFYGPMTLDIGALSGVTQYYGYDLYAVTISASAVNYGAVRARLLIDGYDSGSVYISNYAQSQTIYVSTRSIGRSARSILLQTDGAIRLNELSFRIAR